MKRNIVQPIDAPVRSCQIACFVLIAIMNLSAWIDLQGLFVELPLIVPFTPERWTLPSIAALCICGANIVPAAVVLIRWCQGKRFSEIPYIYMIIIVGVIACFLSGMFWERTLFLFGRERSVWLLGCIFILSMLDCTSSLVFFDYMKRFRTEYLRAVYLGEALTAVIPTVLILIQGVGGETICVQNGTDAIDFEPMYTQPRFSVRIFMFCIGGIIIGSLIAFILLRWTDIIHLANAAETKSPKRMIVTTTDRIPTDDKQPMLHLTRLPIPMIPVKLMSKTVFTFLLIINTINSLLSYGCLPSLSTYALLPFSQTAFYYWSVFVPMAYPFSLLLSFYYDSISNLTLIILAIINWLLSSLIIIIAAKSPCPWLADTTIGACIVITIWLLMSFISGYLRIIIGNRIKHSWSKNNGMFYYGATTQLGLLLGIIPTFLLINVFQVFIDRKLCQSYCVP